MPNHSSSTTTLSHPTKGGSEDLKSLSHKHGRREVALVEQLLFGLTFNAEHGFQHRGDKLSISCTLAVDAGHSNGMTLSLTREKPGKGLDISGIKFKVTVNPEEKASRKEFTITTDDNGSAHIRDIKQHDKVLIELKS